MENRYNLLDEEWIPVVGAGKVSLKRIFSDSTLLALGGTPVEKIAVFKLLLAIAQASCTPKDEDEWRKLGCEGMKSAVLNYLELHRSCFYLYGDRPFLQMPEIKKAKCQPYGALQMEVAVGNTTVVTQIQSERALNDAEKALLLLVQMNFAFGGKKVDNSIVLSDGYSKKKSGNFGSSLGFMGFLHSFIMLPVLLDSIYLNLFTESMIDSMKMFPAGVGKAPWECMPSGENDLIAQNYKKSYMSRLISLNRFLYLEKDEVHNSEGLQLPGYSDMVVDPSVTVDFEKLKCIWTNPEKRPWRQLGAILAFLDGTKSSKFICYQLKAIILADRLKNYSSFSIWSAGVKVSSNAGEQYLTGTDDFVESEIQFEDFYKFDVFYDSLMIAIEKLEDINKNLDKCINSYYKELNVDGKYIAKRSVNVYWQLCEGEFQNIIDICSEDNTEDKLDSVYKRIKSFASQIYDENCPKDTARQMEAWAKNRFYAKSDKNQEEK